MRDVLHKPNPLLLQFITHVGKARSLSLSLIRDFLCAVVKILEKTLQIMVSLLSVLFYELLHFLFSHFITDKTNRSMTDKKEAKGESVKSNVVSHEVYIYMDNKSVKRDIKRYKFNNYACYGVLTWSQTDVHYFE